MGNNERQPHFHNKFGQLWTHKAPNKTLAQRDYVLINKKCKNSAKKLQSITLVY